MIKRDEILTTGKKIILGVLFLAGSVFAQEEVHYEYINVTHSKPVYEEIEVVKPHRHTSDCFEEYHVQKPRYNNRSSENNIGMDTIIGVASGVIIGNQIGKGNGRTAAKVIGGILGGTVANKMRNYKHVDDSYDDDYYYETKKRKVCNIRHSTTHTKRVLKGYKNYFVYNGKRLHKFTKRPKEQVRVTTTISF